MPMPKYGRGKFAVAESYIEYMGSVVEHEAYKDMPNARSPNGRINWQVSSGKSTSFYKDYLARRDWWVRTADSLGVAGKGQENDRFTVAARRIHPTGYRVCRLCGGTFNVGYFYLNSVSAKRFNKAFPGNSFKKGEPIDQVMMSLADAGHKGIEDFILQQFPERLEFFTRHGVSKEAFERSNYLRSTKLSPGFMGNPPDRLDGFHDYHSACRKKNDPGRSDDNMRSYSRDRRSFEWWAEGNWALADALYNLAGPGKCSIEGCGRNLNKVSPDHIGPLACGFQQIAFFAPTCTSHNSAKNRRFTADDVKKLIAYEIRTGQSVASWQIRAHWDQFKHQVQDDEDAKALSNSLRSLQDMYLRVLHDLKLAGKIRFIATFLNPQYALQNFVFTELDPGMLTFKEVAVTSVDTTLRRGLCARAVRIAVNSLTEYASKAVARRKMVREDHGVNDAMIKEAVRSIAENKCELDGPWTIAFSDGLSDENKEEKISGLLVDGKVPRCASDDVGRQRLITVFDEIGRNAIIDFARYK